MRGRNIQDLPRKRVEGSQSPDPRLFQVPLEMPPIGGGKVDGSLSSGRPLAFNPSFSQAPFFYLFINGDYIYRI